MQTLFLSNWRLWQNQAEGCSLLLCADVVLSLQLEAVILPVFALDVCKHHLSPVIYLPVVVWIRGIVAQGRCEKGGERGAN